MSANELTYLKLETNLNICKNKTVSIMFYMYVRTLWLMMEENSKRKYVCKSGL